ncbi:ATP-binding protein [Lutibacter sp. TH_r2]|uniref:sensor histidine kinase n=1 Tax=Lutibacter sp. TH_r2 TaxID=3082083 RepID=UPI0029550924|nr:ATP-binding protein [Lutibacter sp. TH_r2]MDV7186828.1 ATP-binding protein [Lutibacter sp. TH_r2]
MNPLLQRQLKKHLPDHLKNDKSISTFLDAIDKSYSNFESQLAMSQRAMMISSDELSEANLKLKEETVNLKKIINSLNYVVKVLNLESSENIKDINESVNLVKFIEKQSEDILTANKAREELLVNLEEKNQELNNYAHIVSHDLKTPLRSIYTLINWVVEDEKNNLNKKSQTHFDLILENLEKMEALINGILTYSTIDKSQMTAYKIDTFEVVNDIIRMMLIPDNVEVKIDKNLPEITGDSARIQQVFQNLIQNAINSLDKDTGKIEVGVNCANSKWEFYVKDNGKGISKKYFEKIFDIFESIDQRKINSGIGLSIVKKVIHFYGGKIWLESEISKGTTFYFTLPKN